MASMTVEYKGRTYTSTEQTNAEIKNSENTIYSGFPELTKLRFSYEVDSAIMVFGKKIIEESIFIFNYDE